MVNMLKNSAGQRKKERKIRLPLSAGLSYLLIATLVFSGGSLARYTTAASDSVTARVTRFDVATAEATGQAGNIELEAGDDTSSGTYGFSVTNNSEVLVEYSVVVKGMPANVSATLGSETKTANGMDDLVFTAKQLGIGNTDACSLTFYALDGAQTQTVDVTVQVHVEQVD